MLGRVPGLPNELLIDLQSGGYVNLGNPDEKERAEEQALDQLLAAEPTVSYRTICTRTGIPKHRVKELAKTIGWTQGDDGKWRNVSAS